MTNDSHEKFYEMALGVPNGVRGRKIIDELGLPFKFSHETKDDVMSAYFMAKRPGFGNVKITMPSVEDVNEGILQVMPELLGYQAGGRFQNDLLAVRNRPTEAIADIRSMEKVNTSTNEILKKTYVDLLDQS